MSHPTWVRGLKLFSFRCCIVCGWSHPTWVRGLKLKKIYQDEQAGRVAPYVGAWIETIFTLQVSSPSMGRTLRGCVD